MKLDVFEDGQVIALINVQAVPMDGNVIILGSGPDKRFLRVTEVCYQPFTRVVGESYTHGIMVSVKEIDRDKEAEEFIKQNSSSPVTSPFIGDGYGEMQSS